VTRAQVSPFHAEADGVRVAVRVTPRAASDTVGGVRAAADGRLRISVKVTAAPERGKANEALIRLLAKTWRLPPSRLEVVSGAADRDKTLRIAGEGDRKSVV
jgi:uncharacterized protein (TIGR00251 family)